MNNVTRLVVGGTSEVRGAVTLSRSLIVIVVCNCCVHSCAILGNVSVSAYRVTHSIFPLPNPLCNLSRSSEQNNIMFPLHWWTVDRVIPFFLLLPFVSTAPADGARFLIRLRAPTYLHHKHSSLSGVVLRAYPTWPPARPTSPAAHLCWSFKCGSRGRKTARYRSYVSSVLCTYQSSSDCRQGPDYVLV